MTAQVVRKRAHERDTLTNTMDCKSSNTRGSSQGRFLRGHCKRRRRKSMSSYCHHLARSIAIILLSYHPLLLLPYLSRHASATTAASTLSLPDILSSITNSQEGLLNGTEASASIPNGGVLQPSSPTSLIRKRRKLQQMEGSCLNSKLGAGQQRGVGSYLCYPTVNPIYKFGIDSSNQLAYYVNDELIWSATPQPPETSACIVFGSCFVPIHYFRLQGAGALVAYDDSRSKVYDSHRDGGDYSDYAISELGLPEDGVNAVSEKRSGSTLELNDSGVFIVDQEAGNVVTWKIDAPTLETESPTISPTKKPSKSPTVQPTTSSPTKSPVKAQLGSIQGFIWDDTPTNDGLYNSGDLPLSSIPVSLHQCSDDSYIESTRTLDDGTFAMDDLEEGRYRIRVTPPGGISDNNNNDALSNNNGGSATSNSDGLWRFVTKNVNGPINPNSIVAEDSDVNADGTSDCIVVSSQDIIGALQHSVYVGMLRIISTKEEEDPITVSGSIFWDANGDGILDDNDASTDDIGLTMLNNIVVDLYTCPSSSAEPEWIMLTRTDASGKYGFFIDGSGNGNGATTASTTDLTSFLAEQGVSKFRAIVSLPDSGDSTIAFSPTTEESHLNPANGETPCWDVGVDGTGDIVWNAGITTDKEEIIGDDTTPSPTAAAATPATSSPTAATAPQQTITAGIIGGYAFLDSNNDGIRGTTETVLPNINVRLFSCAPPTPTTSAQSFLGSSMQQQQGSTDQLLAMQRTNNEGLYSFRNLFSGNYRVSITPLSGNYEVSSVWSGADEGDDVDNAVDPGAKSTECFPLVGGKTDISWDIGLVEKPLPSTEEGTPTRMPTTVAPVASTPVVISGFVYNDSDNNGYHDDGENSIPEVQVALFNCNGGVISLKNTDRNGMYGFENIVPGPYKVKFMSPQGYAISKVWSGQVDEEGKRNAADATNDADPSTGSTECIGYWEDDFSTDAGMYLQTSAAPPTTSSPPTPDASTAPTTPKPTTKPTNIPEGPCSGAPCSMDGMCRNKAGLCGKGIAFCNPNSIWQASCPPKNVNGDETDSTAPVESPVSDPALTAPSSMPSLTSAPSVSSSPSASPTISVLPTISYEPTSPSKEGSATPRSICNEDGSVGTTATTVTKGDIVSFTYAIKSTNGQPVNINLVTQFESELQLRMSCVYFNHPCLACGSGEEQGSNLRRRRGMIAIMRDRTIDRSMKEAIDISSSSVMGLTSLPTDAPNPVEVCADSQAAATGNCRVISGKFTTYFPLNMDPGRIEQDKNDMIKVVQHELNKNDWDGMQVSYNNAPFPSVVGAEGMELDVKNEAGDGPSGSIGVIIGIVVGALVFVAIIAVSLIFLIRKKREKDELLQNQQQQQRAATAVPFGGALESTSLGSRENLDDESESDMDDSDDESSSNSSSESEGTSLDGMGSGSAPSALSGDTFPTTVAQARPQDIEEDDEESTDDESSDESESIDEEYYDNEELEGGGDNNLERLQQEQQPIAVAPAGDGNPHDMYEDYGGEEYNAGDYNVEEGQGYDHRKYDNVQVVEGEYHDNGYPQNYDDGIDDARSIQSGDPPGTSYRDLPREEEEDWNDQHGMSMGHMPPEQHQQPTQNKMSAGMSGFAGDSYYNGDTTESPQGSYKVYESDGSNGLNDSFKSFSQQLQHLDDNQSNLSGSHHSNQSFGGSTHHSVQSQRTSHSQGSNHSSRSNSNHSSRNSQEREDVDHQQQLQQQHQQDHNQYAEEGQMYGQEEYVDGGNNYDGDEQYHNQGGEPQHTPYNNEYDQYAMDGLGNAAMGHHAYMDNNHMPSGDEGQFGGDTMSDNNPHLYKDSSFSPENTAQAYNDGHDRHDGGGMIHDDEFDEQSYHSFNPTIPSSNPASLSRPEELDEEVSHSGSAYTAVTRQMSNISSHAMTQSKKATSNGGVGGGVHVNISPGEDAFGEEEESITNIFKSLSEIQTRLASKGKQQPPLSDGALTQHDVTARSKKGKSPGDVFAPVSYHMGSGNNNGWGNEGMVEDASVDGSQVSSFATGGARNRRPQHGQWMEPVDED